MPNPLVGVAAASLASSVVGSQGAKRAGEAQENAARTGVAEQRAARESFEQRTEPFRQLGLAAAGPILQSLGIEVPEILASPEAYQSRQRLDYLNEQIEGFDPQSSQPPMVRLASSIKNRGLERGINQGLESASKRQGDARLQELITERDAIQRQLSRSEPSLPGEASSLTPQTELERINPLVSFLRDEGFEDIEESAAAQGRLRSGGTLQDLTRFNTNLAATVVPQLQQQRFNQLFNLLGLGQNAAVGQGSAALSTASNIGNLLQSGGIAQAQGQLGSAQQIQGGISDLSGILGLLQTSPPQTSGGNFNTGTQVDFSSGAVSSPIPNAWNF